jgi:hypothetical protein
MYYLTQKRMQWSILREAEPIEIPKISASDACFKMCLHVQGFFPLGADLIFPSWLQAFRGHLSQGSISSLFSINFISLMVKIIHAYEKSMYHCFKLYWWDRAMSYQSLMFNHSSMPCFLSLQRLYSSSNSLNFSSGTGRLKRE